MINRESPVADMALKAESIPSHPVIQYYVIQLHCSTCKQQKHTVVHTLVCTYFSVKKSAILFHHYFL